MANLGQQQHEEWDSTHHHLEPRRGLDQAGSYASRAPLLHSPFFWRTAGLKASWGRVAEIPWAGLASWSEGKRRSVVMEGGFRTRDGGGRSQSRSSAGQEDVGRVKRFRWIQEMMGA